MDEENIIFKNDNLTSLDVENVCGLERLGALENKKELTTLILNVLQKIEKVYDLHREKTKDKSSDLFGNGDGDEQ